ncbi:MAG: protein kinase domain-containing protein [Polyangiales bacterium]
MSEAHAPTLSAASTRLGAGALFADRFHIVRMLGEGGMGAVYRALDRELDEEIALKLVRPELASEEGALERFRREVKLARRVTHINVARTFDIGVHAGVRFLTMELLEGAPLSRSLERGPMALTEALRIAAEIARGLQAAHAVGVVHRDLKPDNVMISERRIAITDFGIARLADGQHQRDRESGFRTQGMIIGTPVYMAPEQLEGRELDGRADVYALGIVVYQLITGELPFAGDTPFMRLSTPPPDPRAKVASIPSEVAELMLSALARRREERIDAQTFVERLDAHRGGHGVQRQLVSTPPRVSTAMPFVFAGPKRVAIVPLAHDAATAELAARGTEALVDAAAAMRSAALVPIAKVADAAAEHSRAGVLDADALSRAVDADLVIDGSVRAGGERARVRARIFTRGGQTWNDRFEAALSDPFEIEDQLATRVTEALGACLSGRRGPQDKAARALYEQAMGVDGVRFEPKDLREAIRLLEEADRIAPDDPSTMSALGEMLNTLWNTDPSATDNRLIARAEELSLRALSLDPTLGEAYATIGVVRLQHGELRAAVRAFHDAIARSPLEFRAHAYLGDLLGECGHVDEALRRFDLVLQIDPTKHLVWMDKARLLELRGDHAGYEAAMALVREHGGAIAAFIDLRISMWRGDATPKPFERTPLSEMWLAPIYDAMIGKESETDRYLEMSRTHASLRRRTYLHQLRTECLCRLGLVDRALGALEEAAGLTLVDVLWLDRCPVLAPLRDDPRFARARAIVSERAASMWS